MAGNTNGTTTGGGSRKQATRARGGKVATARCDHGEALTGLGARVREVEGKLAKLAGEGLRDLVKPTVEEVAGGPGEEEIELAFVIGKETKNITEAQAPGHILGYCIANDISEREWQLEMGGNWTKGKSGDTFGPIGPYLVTKDEIPNINNLSLNLKLNGK